MRRFPLSIRRGAGLILGTDGVEKTDADHQEHRGRTWRVYLAVMAAISAVYLFGAHYGHAPSVLNSGWVFNLIGLSSVGAILVAVRRSRVKNRLPWYLFAAGQLLFVAGDILAYNYK